MRQLVANPQPQFVHAEGLGQVVISPEFKAGEAVVGRDFGSEQQHRNVAGAQVGFEFLAKGVAIHDGHHHVRQHQVGQFGQGHLPALLPIGGTENAVVGGQALSDVLRQFVMIFHHQHQRLLVVGGQIERGHFLFPVGHGRQGWLCFHRPIRQTDHKGRTVPYLACDGDFPCLQIHQFLHQRQSQTHSR